MTVAERVAVVRRRIEEACRRAGRAPDDVTLVAVGKTFPAHVVREALDAGITDLGENRAQELREKATAIRGARWHFVGPLQTNKVRHVVGVATLIHSIDRIGLAQSIARRAQRAGEAQDVLIEVNVGGEASKNGVEPAGLRPLVDQLEDLDGLRVRGLMTIPPLTPEPERSRRFYADLRGLRDVVVERWPGATVLSMGMSRDLEVAIEEGATLVRVGEAIFGSRKR